MKHKTKYPSGSPRDILVRLKRMEREVKQILVDVQSVNDNNPNFADNPMDVGRYLVQLKIIRDVIKAVKSAIESGATKLPGEILDPLNKPW